MRALFIHDHPFVQDRSSGSLYTSGNLNSALWERYLKHFDCITVLGRCRIEADVSRYSSAERDNVTFKLFSDVVGGVDYFTKRKMIEKRLAEEIDKHDIIIMRFPATISVFAAEYCIKRGIKYVAEVVGCAWDANWNYGGLLPRMIAPYSYLKMKKAVWHASASIYVTENFLQKRYPTNARIVSSASNVILNNVELDVLPERLKRIESSAKGSAVCLGIIGNIGVRYKGYDVLLKALNFLPDELRKRIHIIFVGGGNADYLNGLIKEYDVASQVTIRGKLQGGKEIFEFLDGLDLYVHPSRQEGLPRVVIEAMSRSCPVLASSVAGTPELLSRDYLHVPGDAKKLAVDLKGVIDNKIILKRMANENFERSKSYLFNVLELKRENFFKEVKASFLDAPSNI